MDAGKKKGQSAQAAARMNQDDRAGLSLGIWSSIRAGRFQLSRSARLVDEFVQRGVKTLSNRPGTRYKLAACGCDSEPSARR